VSEPSRPAPDARAVAWIAAQSALDFALSTLTLGEIEKGMALMAAGRRRAALEAWLEIDLPMQFAERLLPVDEAVARSWGRLTAAGRRQGRQLPVIDGLLLATAQVHGLALVTRNEADFTGYGVAILNPYTR
jgi:predicted nucleic acid-binding protein